MKSTSHVPINIRWMELCGRCHLIAKQNRHTKRRGAETESTIWKNSNGSHNRSSLTVAFGVFWGKKIPLRRTWDHLVGNGYFPVVDSEPTFIARGINQICPCSRRKLIHNNNGWMARSFDFNEIYAKEHFQPKSSWMVETRFDSSIRK